MASLNLFEIVSVDEPLVLAVDTWHDREFEVALDSGAVVHVCSLVDCPGYALQESPGSKSGQKFLMGDGGTIANLGQKSLNLCDEGVSRNLCSIFQIAAGRSAAHERWPNLRRGTQHHVRCCAGDRKGEGRC